MLRPHMPNETSRDEIDDSGYSIEVIYSAKRAMTFGYDKS